MGFGNDRLLYSQPSELVSGIPRHFVSGENRFAAHSRKIGGLKPTLSGVGANCYPTGRGQDKK